MRRLTFLLLTLSFLAAPAASSAALEYPLHYNNRGQAVCDAQWLLSGRGKPSVYRQPWFRVWKQPIRKGKRCVFNARMSQAVIGMKWKLGYCPKARYKDKKGKVHYCRITSKYGYDLRNILTGKIRRTWAMQRAGLLRHYPPKKCTVADRVVQLARHELGVQEVPWGSNSGPRVRVYQSVTGAYYAAWCVSWAQAILKWAGIGPVANRSAGVGYVRDYAYRHRWTRNDIKKGYLVAWGSRHMGIIDLVTPTGYYVDEGNHSNGVGRRFYRRGYLGGTLIEVPGLDRKIKCGS